MDSSFSLVRKQKKTDLSSDICVTTSLKAYSLDNPVQKHIKKTFHFQVYELTWSAAFDNVWPFLLISLFFLFCCCFRAKYSTICYMSFRYVVPEPLMCDNMFILQQELKSQAQSVAVYVAVRTRRLLWLCKDDAAFMQNTFTLKGIWLVN